MPLGQIEGELVAHVSRQSHMVVQIVRRKDAADMSVCANSYGANLVAALNKISCGKKLGLAEDLVEVEHDYSPAVVLQLKWHLSHEAIGAAEVFEKVAYRNAHAVRSFGHAKVQMIAECETMARALHLQVAVAAGQAEAPCSALRMRRLNIVVR